MIMRIVARSKMATTLGGIIALGAIQPAHAQMQTVDPDNAYQGAGNAASGAIDGDLNGELPPVANDPYTATDPYAAPSAAPAADPVQTEVPVQQPAPVDPAYPATTGQVATPYPAEQAATQAAAAPAAGDTYQEDDLIGAAEGVFGKGAEGLAGLIEKILKDQGEPNGYIVGREAGGAFIAGLRYGSGTLHHKIEGEMPIYWTGPSVGFDFGANAASTFVLVYNLWDTEQLYERYPAGEGAAYVVGGLNASYLRKGDVVLIPIRLGAGARLGINAGYMKFSHKQKWMPF